MIRFGVTPLEADQMEVWQIGYLLRATDESDNGHKPPPRDLVSERMRAWREAGSPTDDRGLPVMPN